MAYQRGNVVAVPYEYSNLMAGKVRPAVIVSSGTYNRNRPDVLIERYEDEHVPEITEL